MCQLNDAKRKGQLALGVDADYTNLYRYAAVLKKEDKLDKDERAGVEQSVVRSRSSLLDLCGVSKRELQADCQHISNQSVVDRGLPTVPSKSRRPLPFAPPPLRHTHTRTPLGRIIASGIE